MNKDTNEGKWKQIKGEFKDQYGKITNDESKEAEGKKDKLIGEIQEKYGKTKDEIAEEIKSW
ncbi:general stress protein CsbD [Polaribacter reichenbachii]|uniref:General stress protein CsbD n=1 Tax=Polaribacter reichenbachii TaxID=996801 RepID=A0A1B8U1K9_9FLAO|nr:CsbD family protein [Polaribacter reichenbachii]APZ47274.1 general stress protein CsbD [Polaribacter reichenbachii]AUC17915.1 general stress protein CsbD [Polaribacter reichenbachii]OBY65760.1 general stress protein CsbD [Polaribacter reichenbachii]